MPAYETEERDERGRWTSGGGAALRDEAAKEVWDEKGFALTGPQEASALYYTGDGSSLVNQFLRNPEGLPGTITYHENAQGLKTSWPEHVEANVLDHVDNLDTAITSQPGTSADTILYRGVSSKHGNEFAGVPVGGTINEPGYMSTTTSGDTATAFTTKSATGYSGEPGTILDITAPAGTKGLDISAPGADLHRGEEEVLLPRGLSMQVTGHSMDRNIPHIQVNLVPQK